MGIKFIDLFAGMGGFRLGFEQACLNLNVKAECVYSSEIKAHARQVYAENFNDNFIGHDIRNKAASEIPDFDYLLAGFPCQAFSAAGKGKGFNDKRGHLFMEIYRILADKKPKGFILENVDGLLTHDKGNTFQVIFEALTGLGYFVVPRIINSADFGSGQNRKRIYIVGSLDGHAPMNNFEKNRKVFGQIQEYGLPTLETDFTKALKNHFKSAQLYGKAIKDKRGGSNNIHSWDLELKGPISETQKALLSELLKQRRHKQWAERKGIVWSDGMPLTATEITEFFNDPKLKELLDDLVAKNYLVYEHPKNILEGSKEKVPDTTKERGYNIVTGKLSFPFTKILDPEQVTPTLVATDIDHLAVIDLDGIRKLSKLECLRLFNFPEDYKMNISDRHAYDLFGNTVDVAVVTAVASRLLVFDENLVFANYVNAELASQHPAEALFR